MWCSSSPRHIALTLVYFRLSLIHAFHAQVHLFLFFCICFFFLVIVILSHGKANDSIAATDGLYNLNELILYPILDIPSLKDKPKIFIIQACKGDLVPGEYKTDALTTRGPPTEILKCYSTFEGIKLINSNAKQCTSTFIYDFLLRLRFISNRLRQSIRPSLMR